MKPCVNLQACFMLRYVLSGTIHSYCALYEGSCTVLLFWYLWHTIILIMRSKQNVSPSQSHPVQTCSGPVMTCFVHRLIQAFFFHWDLWMKETSSPLTVNGKTSSQNLSICYFITLYRISWTRYQRLVGEIQAQLRVFCYPS